MTTATATETLTVADLERLLNSRKMQLEELLKKRGMIQRQLQQLDADIAALEGQRRGGPRGKRGQRMKNERSLRLLVLDQLAKSKSGYNLADLAQRILDTGYQTTSTNFRNVLYQCLYNTKEVFHDESTGTYKLKPAPGKGRDKDAEGSK
jgi:hypothetical protein